MNYQGYLNDQLSRHLIRERVARAAEPRLETGSPRQRMAQRLHRWAARIDT